MGPVITLFDGATLAGWHAVPRLPSPPRPGAPEPNTESAGHQNAARHPARWSVVDGAIVGAQDPPGSGFGGYLLTGETYADVDLDTATIQLPAYDRERVTPLLGRAGHIVLEVHNNDPMMGQERWWPGAVCRWKTLRLQVIDNPRG